MVVFLAGKNDAFCDYYKGCEEVDDSEGGCTVCGSMHGGGLSHNVNLSPEQSKLV